MTKVIVDKNLQARLNNLQDKAELCDEAGRTLGIVLSEKEYWELQLVADGCPYTYEEMVGFRQETGGRTLAEIWQGLKSK
jgi:hypothetical protein